MAITPASGFVGPKGALAVGIVAGLVSYWGATWLKPKLGYDDSLNVFAVEAIGSTAGALEGNVGQIRTQIFGIATTIVWSGVASAIILFVIDKVIGFRVDEESETEGIDFSQHGEIVR